MDDEIVQPLMRIMHHDFRAGSRKNGAGIADLPAALAIKRRLVEQDLDLVAGGGLRNFDAGLEDRRDLSFGGFSLVAQKFGGTQTLLEIEPSSIRCAFAGPAPGG